MNRRCVLAECDVKRSCWGPLRLVRPLFPRRVVIRVAAGTVGAASGLWHVMSLGELVEQLEHPVGAVLAGDGARQIGGDGQDVGT